MRFATRRNVVLGACGFLVALAGTVLWCREPTEALTRESLRLARERWHRAAVSSYVLRYRMHASLFEVHVQDGIVEEVTVDGQRPTSTNRRAYGVDGLFDTLEQELDLVAESGEASPLHLRVRFSPEFGYIERFLRSASGIGKPASIQDVEFRPVPTPKGQP